MMIIYSSKLTSPNTPKWLQALMHSLTYSSRPEPIFPPPCSFRQYQEKKRERNIKNKIKPKQNFLFFPSLLLSAKHTKMQPKIQTTSK